MTDRCEPPEELRGVDGWHWVEAPAIKMQFVRRWWRARGEWCWADMDERTLRSFRYLSPVVTPTEVAALRAEVARLRDALDELVMACELPGDHCEVEQALPSARAALEPKP